MDKAEQGALLAGLAVAAHFGLPALLKLSPDKPTEFQYVEMTPGIPVSADRETAIRAFNANHEGEVIRGNPLELFSPRAQEALAKLIESRKAAGHPHSIIALVTEAMRLHLHRTSGNNQSQAKTSHNHEEENEQKNAEPN